MLTHRGKLDVAWSQGLRPVSCLWSTQNKEWVQVRPNEDRWARSDPHTGPDATQLRRGYIHLHTRLSIALYVPYTLRGVAEARGQLKGARL